LQPLAGRRLWFAGVGGAGLSAYAVIASAWGADVAGWDRKETPYLAAVRAAGIPVEIADEPPAPPDGREAVVSTAYADRIEGLSRARFLAELTGHADAIVVSGAHGKTTTAAMIAFVLERLGRDPSYAIGGEVPQLGGNARAGSGWFVVEGDESDRTVEALRPSIAVITNVDLDHHATFASRAEVEEMFESWAATLGAESVVRGDELAPLDVRLAVPGEHNRQNAAAALRALELAGVAREEALPVLQEFGGAGRRLEPRGEAGGVRVLDDYAHHPAEIEASLRAARELAGEGRVLVLFQPHLPSRTRHLARELAGALALADAACVTDVYLAREDPIPGVTGKRIVEALTEIRPGMRAGWAPAVGDAVPIVASWARPGDLALTVGAGDVDSAVPALLERLGAGR
jgi:UDP-N-acetylmuramate--alanine ligase